MSNFKQPWLIRRLAYAILATIIAIALGFGWITAEQGDQLLSQADQILGVITVMALSVASVKANPQSDLPGGRHRAGE